MATIGTFTKSSAGFTGNPANWLRLVASTDNGGADVMYAERFGVSDAAKERKVLAIGNVINTQDKYPETVVASALWNMEPTIDLAIKAVKDGKFKADDYGVYSTMKHKGSELAPLGTFEKKIPADVDRRLTIASTAHRVAESLAHLEADANREILTQAAAILGVTAWLVLWAGIVAVLLVETTNYIEHYGLLRQQDANGRFETCKPQHSWNSNHVFSNWATFHLQRHSDHHAHPLRRYQSLRHFDNLPRLRALLQHEVAAAVVYVATGMGGPGHVQHHGLDVARDGLRPNEPALPRARRRLAEAAHSALK